MRHFSSSLFYFAVAAVLLFGCGPPQANDEDDGNDLPSATPEWSPCAMKDEVASCAELCGTHDMECVENGCPAELVLRAPRHATAPNWRPGVPGKPSNVSAKFWSAHIIDPRNGCSGTTPGNGKIVL
jgi:hypothetical protein